MKQFIDFINQTPNAYFAAKNIADILQKEGYKELSEKEDWDLSNEKYYLKRNDGTVVAFRLPKEAKRFLFVVSHGDSPCYYLKTNCEMLDKGYIKLNTEPYGGMLSYTWFDRPLSLSGRVVIKKDGKYQTKLINIEKDLLVIPSLCAHQTPSGSAFNPNPQKELLPILAISNEKGTFKKMIDEISGAEVIESDLYVYNRDQARYVGLNDEFILAPRIDNLGTAFSTLYGFLNAEDNSENIDIYVCFNNEECGSLTLEGANSTLLSDVVERIAEAKGLNLKKCLRDSFLLSADNGHALHPNYQEKCDPTNQCYLNQGVMIKHHTNYTTSGFSSAIFRDICAQNNIPYQDFAARSDGRNGGTLGKISLSHVSVLSCDIGLAQWAMHSANETCGSKDLQYMIDAIKAYFESNFRYENE